MPDKTYFCNECQEKQKHMIDQFNGKTTLSNAKIALDKVVLVVKKFSICYICYIGSVDI